MGHRQASTNYKSFKLLFGVFSDAKHIYIYMGILWSFWNMEPLSFYDKVGSRSTHLGNTSRSNEKLLLKAVQGGSEAMFGSLLLKPTSQPANFHKTCLPRGPSMHLAQTCIWFHARAAEWRACGVEKGLPCFHVFQCKRSTNLYAPDSIMVEVEDDRFPHPESGPHGPFG